MQVVQKVQKVQEVQEVQGARTLGAQQVQDLQEMHDNKRSNKFQDMYGMKVKYVQELKGEQWV